MAIEIKEFVGYNLGKETTNMACGGKKTTKKATKKSTSTKKK